MKTFLKTLLYAAIVLSGCAANPANGSRTFSLVSAREERAIGESAAESVLKTYGLYKPEGRTARYVVEVCQKVYAQTEMAADPVTCTFIDDGTFNASATPGYMLINRGLLPYMSSEAELAAVLGHEAGHLTARHINQAATHAKVATIGMAVLAGVVAAKSNSQATTNAAIAAGTVGATLGLAAYSRAHETEADALGRRYMEKLGYDPREAVNMVQAMNMYDTYQQQRAAAFGTDSRGGGLLDRLASSHPATPERIAAAFKATGLPPEAAPDNDTTGRARFMEAIEGLAFGPAIKFGVARRGELALPRQRTVLPLPDGTLTAHIPPSSPDDFGTWQIVHPQSRTQIAVSTLRLTQGRSPAAVVKDLLPLLHGEVQQVVLGTETTPVYAHTATYRQMGSGSRHRLLAVPAAPSLNQMLVLVITYPDEATEAREDTGLMAILKGVRHVSEERAKRYQPLVLHSFRATAGDTVANRAAKIPVNALQEELFRALNNLPAGTEMIPGQLYKTLEDPNF